MLGFSGTLGAVALAEIVIAVAFFALSYILWRRMIAGGEAYARGASSFSSDEVGELVSAVFGAMRAQQLSLMKQMRSASSEP